MIIADLHIHSKYSRATSRECTPEHLDLWARRKGIQLIGTGDFTHPAWRGELAQKLVRDDGGFYVLRDTLRLPGEPKDAKTPRFVLSGEISSIYKKDGRVRKVHNVIILPDLEQAQRLAARLEKIGNLHSDGRPILGLDSRDLLEITLDTSPDAIFIPAHIWTPHFSMFGAFSGFDTIEQCFGDMTPHIHALETGLSSDPPMNWRLSALDGYTLVSNSDAHSPQKLGREANLLDIEPEYAALAGALGEKAEGFCGTIEFFPEQGKYHYDGHRSCRQCLTPEQTLEANGRCPVCGGKITVGVLHRVEQLADRPEGFRPPCAKRFEQIVPLPEIIAASTGYSPACARVQTCYESMLSGLGDEFTILLKTPVEDIEKAAGPYVAQGVLRMRKRRIGLSPGYDGEFGKIEVFAPGELDAMAGQTCLFEGAISPKKKREKTPRTPKKGGAKRGRDNDAIVAAVPNEGQSAAIAAACARVAVAAGPGTGKTQTLALRISKLIDDGAKPSAITAVTFTNQAARELRERLERKCGKRASRAIHAGTFHSICLELLSARDKIELIDEYDALTVAGEVCGELKLSVSPRQLLEDISRVKNGAEPVRELLPEANALYRERLEEYGVCDYDDLLTGALALCGNGLTKREQARFEHLLVDEFQDVSDLQYRLIEAWAKHACSVFVIGDPDQSIYGFRGASPETFSRFADSGAAVYRLDKNYRSTPEILRCAEAVIKNNAPVLNISRSLNAQRKSARAVCLVRCESEFAQAVFIAKQISRMVGGIDMATAQNTATGRGFGDFAVLYRTHRQSQILEKCLSVEGIPYIVSGRDKLLGSPDVRAALRFFKTVSLMRAEKSGEAREALANAAAGNRFGASIPKQWVCLAKSYAESSASEKPCDALQRWMTDTGRDSEDMRRLCGMGVFYDSMEEFLSGLTLSGESDARRSATRRYNADSVRLYTLHGAKGLEFPVTFLCGVRRGLLPLEGASYKTELEEERRLFYVGITRARDELFLLCDGELSPFVAALPDGTLDEQSAAAYRRDAQPEQLCF